MRTRSLRELQQRQEQHVDVAPARLRRAADALHDGVARLGLFGEAVDLLVEEHGVGLGPVVEERGAQAVDRRARQPEVGVAPLVLVAGVALPLVGDADAAGEGDRLVDDHHLAVGAVVDLGRPEAAQRPEPAHLHAGVAPCCAPASVGSVVRPQESRSTRTRTPAWARAASRVANSVPISPSQYTKVRRSIVCSASSMASSMAGKISSPLRSTSTRLPSVAGTPRTPSRARRNRSRRRGQQVGAVGERHRGAHDATDVSRCGRRLGLGVGDLVLVLRARFAGADGLELRGDRAAVEHDDRGEQRTTAGGRRCRPAGRRCRRRSCSGENELAESDA